MTAATDDIVRVRPYRGGEDQALYDAVIESREQIAPFMPWAHPEYCLEDTARWIEHAASSFAAGTAYEYVVEDAATGRFLGGVGLNSLDVANKRANLGYWTRTSASGRGVATRAAALMAQMGLTVLGLTRVEIFAAVHNVGSVRVMERIGARREGILRRRLHLRDGVSDAVLYSLIEPSEIRFPGPS